MDHGENAFWLQFREWPLEKIGSNAERSHRIQFYFHQTNCVNLNHAHYVAMKVSALRLTCPQAIHLRIPVLFPRLATSGSPLPYLLSRLVLLWLPGGGSKKVAEYERKFNQKENKETSSLKSGRNYVRSSWHQHCSWRPGAVIRSHWIGCECQWTTNSSGWNTMWKPMLFL